MKLVDISADTERAFFTCLHLEEPENLMDTSPLRNWYAEYKNKGYKAQVLLLDDGRIVENVISYPLSIRHSLARIYWQSYA